MQLEVFEKTRECGGDCRCFEIRRCVEIQGNTFECAGVAALKLTSEHISFTRQDGSANFDQLFIVTYCQHVVKSLGKVVKYCLGRITLITLLANIHFQIDECALVLAFLTRDLQHLSHFSQTSPPRNHTLPNFAHRKTLLQASPHGKEARTRAAPR